MSPPLLWFLPYGSIPGGSNDPDQTHTQGRVGMMGRVGRKQWELTKKEGVGEWTWWGKWASKLGKLEKLLGKWGDWASGENEGEWTNGSSGQVQVMGQINSFFFESIYLAIFLFFSFIKFQLV